MRLIEALSLTGGSATLIEIERDSEYDGLLARILESGYYDHGYCEVHGGYKPGRHVAHFWLLAEMLAVLGPRRAMEVGCSRGDLLSLLARHGVEVAGIDLSAESAQTPWPEVRGRLKVGPLEDVGNHLAGPFDLLLGLDVWEHLHPGRLGAAIDAVSSLAAPDALAFFVVPAFGPDRLFGEPFPLEFEQNRAAFVAGEPFRFLTAESVDPPLPFAGHLIWAPASWWESQFTSRGWKRVESLEPLLRAFDRFVPFSVRSAYLFRRDTPQAAQRVAATAARELRPHWRVARGLLRAAREDPEEAARRWVIPHLPGSLRRAYRHLKAMVTRSQGCSGNATIEMTMRDSHLSPDSRREAVAAFDQQRGEATSEPGSTRGQSTTGSEISSAVPRD